LSRIAALRQRLETRPALAADDRPAAPPPDPVRALAEEVATGHRHNFLLDGTVRRLAAAAGAPAETTPLPRHLTARVRRLLHQGQELLARLRALADEPLLNGDPTDPLAERYRRTLAMADTTLRLVPAFPDAPGAQLKLCEGLEETLDAIDERLAALTAAVEQRRHHRGAVTTLAALLADLAAGKPVELPAFIRLAEAVLSDARDAAPLQLYHPATGDPAEQIACHGLVTAQVIARVVRQDPELRGQALEATLAALVHDVGMLAIDPAAWNHDRPLTDAQQRLIEGHTRAGAERIGRRFPGSGWLAEACACHHERLDGTGYPEGLRELQLAPLVRLLAVCDVYAALASPRRHRPAREPRTALTDTLLLAEKGLLDRGYAERLLALSFYPVGSVVELTDGALARVVAHHQGPRDLTTPARPVLAVLTDSHGRPLPLPRHLDLSEAEGRAIVRTLPPAEGRQLLGPYFPDAAC
jgi:hypothetical protein